MFNWGNSDCARWNSFFIRQNILTKSILKSGHHNKLLPNSLSLYLVTATTKTTFRYCLTLENFMAPFYGWGSTAWRLATFRRQFTFYQSVPTCWFTSLYASVLSRSLSPGVERQREKERDHAKICLAGYITAITK